MGRKKQKSSRRVGVPKIERQDQISSPIDKLPIPENSAQGQIDLGKAITDDMTVHKNISQDIIIINIDRLRLCLTEHFSSSLKDDWKTSLALSISLLLAILSADFKDFIINKHVWSAVFIILFIFSSLWFLLCLPNLVNTFKSSPVDNLIGKLKESHDKSQIKP